MIETFLPFGVLQVYKSIMVKWLVALVLVLVVCSVIAQRLAARRLPGDFTIPVRGRIYYIPLASTLLFSLLVWALSKLL
jgi:hypothetical protein